MTARNSFELILLAALWGASFLFMRIATPEFGAVALIEVRVLVASLFLLPIWFYREGAVARKTAQKHWRPIVIVGILNSALPFVLFAYSTLHITGGFSSILNSTVPLWGALVAWLWLGKLLSREAMMGILLGLLGVAVLLSGSFSFTQSQVTLGIFAALFASVLYGIAANYAAEKLAKVSPLSIATFSQVAATIILLPFAVWLMPQTSISLNAWVSVVVLGVFCTGLAYTLYFRLIGQVGSTKAVTVTFLIPMFGTFWGALFIDEIITLEMVIGMLIILIGTAMVNGVLSFKSKVSQSKG
jgi:drug/metabolite transporter (DMT)-like permease